MANVFGLHLDTYFRNEQKTILKVQFRDPVGIKIMPLLQDKPKRHPPKQSSLPPEDSSPSASGSMENFDKFHKVSTPPRQKSPPPKKSGKSYASKRKERQQLKEKSKAQNSDEILDLPSD